MRRDLGLQETEPESREREARSFARELTEALNEQAENDSDLGPALRKVAVGWPRSGPYATSCARPTGSLRAARERRERRPAGRPARGGPGHRRREADAGAGARTRDGARPAGGQALRRPRAPVRVHGPRPRPVAVPPVRGRAGRLVHDEPRTVRPRVRPGHELRGRRRRRPEGQAGRRRGSHRRRGRRAGAAGHVAVRGPLPCSTRTTRSTASGAG